MSVCEDVSPDCPTVLAQLRDDKKFKYIIYKVVNGMLVTETTAVDGVWDDLKERLLSEHPRFPAFAIYDFGEDYQHKLALISWCPDTAPPRIKMAQKSNQTFLKRMLDSPSIDILASDEADLDEGPILEHLDKL
ncbi:cofilin [Fusarium pseudoanthophilum]|uniref:Cofilin n=1 Tax=Fusarium pseudoanthophilum TaxID=48495 RepID=A0A8H5UUV6_9HYPO|nr:cofilin [Fusarium pseudoanthophilum]